MSKLHLSISDDGKGFDTKDTSERQGLGLWSMRERARLIERPIRDSLGKGKGTRIDVWTLIKLNSDAIPSEPATEPASVPIDRFGTGRRLNCGANLLHRRNKGLVNGS